MIKNHILFTSLSAISFTVVALFHMVFLLEIIPPLKGFLVPATMGAIAGFLISLWRERSKILHIKILQHQNELQQTIDERTQELEFKNRELIRLSATDPLTGLANRRQFGRTLKNEWSRLTRTDAPLSLIMCDIDMFKQYNDTYGHQKGDQCIQEVSEVLTDHANRLGDLVARYGGEEFCLILPNTDYSNALNIAEKIRLALEQRGIEHRSSNVAQVVTISLGVSCAKQMKIGWESSLLLKAADKALYQAKGSGRNQVQGQDIDGAYLLAQAS